MSNHQSRADKAHANKARPARVKMNTGGKMDIPASLREDGYFYYWAIDRKGAIEQMEAAWYEKVKNERGDFVTVPAGGGETHYLMRIEQKYYDEDFNAQQARNTATTNQDAQLLGDNEYIPMGSKAVVERDLI